MTDQFEKNIKDIYIYDDDIKTTVRKKLHLCPHCHNVLHIKRNGIFVFCAKCHKLLNR